LDRLLFRFDAIGSVREVDGMVVSPDGQELSLVAADLARPDALAFSPDEKEFYVDDSERRLH
jgi:sugar lactone lactonase YvrE